MKRILSIILTAALIMSLTCCGAKETEKSESSKSTVKDASSKEVSTEDASDESITDKQEQEVAVNTQTITFPEESPKRIAVETDAATAVNSYIVARMYLDKFLQYDVESGNPEEYSKLLDDTVKAFEKVEKMSAELEESAGELEVREARAELLHTISNFQNPFVVTVYAAEESDAVKWAKDITERFDSAPVGKGISTLAKQMGTDAKHAYAQLRQAQDILKGAAYEDFADTANTAYKTAKVLKTAGTAASLTLSIVTAGQSSVAEAVISGGGIIMNGVNTALEVGETGSILFVGDDNKLSAAIGRAEDAIAPIGATIGLFGLASNLSKGADLIDDVPAMADSIMYVGTSIYDYMVDGKILGGMFSKGEDGTVSATMAETTTIDKPLKDSTEEVAQVLKTVGFTDDEIKEIQETESVDSEPFDIFAELPAEKIDSILEEVGSVEVTSSETESIEDSAEESDISEERDISEESDTLEEDSITEKDSLTEDEPETESEEVAASNGSIPDISELPGTYGFVLHMTLGDQSGDVEAPNTIALSGGSSLTMTDVDGQSMNGTYDSSTGVAEFYDTDGTPVKVVFTRKDNGNIHAKLSMGGDGFSASGSADKQ